MRYCISRARACACASVLSEAFVQCPWRQQRPGGPRPYSCAVGHRHPDEWLAAVWGDASYTGRRCGIWVGVQQLPCILTGAPIRTLGSTRVRLCTCAHQCVHVRTLDANSRMRRAPRGSLARASLPDWQRMCRAAGRPSRSASWTPRLAAASAPCRSSFVGCTSRRRAHRAPRTWTPWRPMLGCGLPRGRSSGASCCCRLGPSIRSARLAPGGMARCPTCSIAMPLRLGPRPGDSGACLPGGRGWYTEQRTGWLFKSRASGGEESHFRCLA